MKRLSALVLFAIFCIACTSLSFAETWYIRSDGGTRFSTNATTGQCNGKADAAYPGTGVNQACAFSDYRYLWDDRATYGVQQWVIAGGDTVIIDNTKQWRVGFDQGVSSSDVWCYGANGTFACTNPTIPAGTAAQHTRILGRNYAKCSTGNTSIPANMTQIFGGFGVGSALNLSGAQYVDVECLEITRHSECIVHGSPAYPSVCGHDGPIDDYDSDGVTTDQNTHDLLLQDLWIHGHTDRGIIGPIGGTVTANRVDIAYNGMAGWDFDDGSGTPSVNATLNFLYSTIEWNGCNQQYPIVDTYPAISCYSQSSGGYGDGIGTPADMGMNVNIDHSIFRYNTQDGEDFGHINTGNSTLSITNSLSYGNNGGQFKWGPNFYKVTFENNLEVGNCLRMSSPITGAPSTFNTNLYDYCRSNDDISFNFRQGGTAVMANNTFVSYAPATFDIQCVDESCSQSSLVFENNIVRGYDNPSTYDLGGQAGGPGGFCGAGCNGSTGVLGTFTRNHNIYYGLRGSCIANTTWGGFPGQGTDEYCEDAEFTSEPQSFTNEATLDSYNFHLTSGSPAVKNGVIVSGLLTDYAGVTYPNPPSLGALEFVGTTTTSTTPSNPTPPAQTPPAATTTSIVFTSSTVGAGFANMKTQVAAASSKGIPTGTVSLYLNGINVWGALQLDSTGSLTMLLPAGFEGIPLKAVYSGSTKFLTSTGTYLPK